jgi:uncharacterized protein (TIGR02597 family)
MTAGINLSSSDTFFYYDGSIGALPNPQWARLGSGPPNFGKHPLAPSNQMIIRHNIAGDTEITPIGDVYTTMNRTLVNVITTGVDQDNAVFLNVPVDVSLAGSNLVQSGAFAGNSTFNAAASDSVLVYDNSAIGQNKSSAQTYFYHDGTLLPAGWRLSGGGPTIYDAEIVFSLDKQVIIRKKGAAMGSEVWDMTPNYLPFP